ncbi:helicase RepA family protein [Vibrio rarus]|uniref:helicase RepA family protein n=1 Tax=Vibrio rarus TaxID=413403 RepID=UPI0021C2A845|nr:helicase RepA family protein [Vibrio rarus]
MLIQSLDNLLNQEKQPLDFTLNGLLKSHVGMLIAAPNIGKSHLAMCLAMEHSSSMVLLGMCANKKPAKTLIVSSEDSAQILQNRMEEKLVNCSVALKNELKQNLHFMTDVEPLVIPPEGSMQEQEAHKLYVQKVMDTFSQFDLVIIDTVTESIGRCDEVKHDRHIKNVFQQMAQKSGASLLLVHHVNKDEIRGNQEITMASGAGLTSVMRLTKCLFTLKSKDNQLSIKYLKCNYLPSHENKEFNVEIKNGLTINPERVELKISKSRSIKNEAILNTPKSITLGGSLSTNETPKNNRNLREVL